MTKLSSKFSSTFWVTTQTTFTQLFGLALFAIQAPVLGPRAFGLISIVMVFTGFCETVLTEASMDALISLPVIEELHFATMTTVTLAAAAAIAVVIFALAAPIAHLFADAELTAVFRSMAVLPIIAAFAAAPGAATKRALEFRPLAVRSIAGVAAGGSVGLVLTLMGFGVWALVWQAIVQRLASVVILWWAVPLRLHLAVSSRHLNDLKAFIGPLMLSRTMKWASGQIPRFLLGLYLGASELGLFSLASRLNDILIQVTVISKYAVMRLEFRLFLANPGGLGASLQNSLRQMSIMYFPLFVGAAAVMPALFRVWLDPRWFGGIVPAQLMLLMGVPSVTLFAIGALLMALNHQKTEALLAIVDTVATVVLVLLAAPFGLLVATAAFASRPFAVLPLNLRFASTQCGLGARLILMPQIPALAAASSMGALVWLVGRFLQPSISAVGVLATQIAVGVMSYTLLCCLLLPAAARRRFKDLRQQLRDIGARRA